MTSHEEGTELNKFIYIFSTGIGASTTSTGSGIFVKVHDQIYFVTNVESFQGKPGDRFGVYMLSKKSNFWFALTEESVKKTTNLVSVKIPPRDQLCVKGRRTNQSGPNFIDYDGCYGVCTVGDSLKIITYLSVLKAEVPIILHGCFSGLLSDGRILVQAPKHPEKFGLIFTMNNSVMGITQPIGVSEFQCGILWSDVEQHFGVDPTWDPVRLSVIESETILENISLDTVLDSLKAPSESVRHVLGADTDVVQTEIVNVHFNSEIHKIFVDFLDWCINPTNELPSSIAKEMFGTDSFLEDMLGNRFCDCSKNTIEHALTLLQTVEQTLRAETNRKSIPMISMTPWDKKTKNIMVSYSRFVKKDVKSIKFIVIENDILDTSNIEVVTMEQCIRSILNFCQ